MQYFYLVSVAIVPTFVRNVGFCDASPDYKRTLIRIYFYFLSCASFPLLFLHFFRPFHFDRLYVFFFCFIRRFDFSIYISILELNVFTYKYKQKLAQFCWTTTKRWTNYSTNAIAIAEHNYHQFFSLFVVNSKRRFLLMMEWADERAHGKRGINP